MIIIDIVNTILFLLFCLIGLYYLFNDFAMIPNPLIKNQKYIVTGPQFFFIFTLAMGMIRLGEWSAIRLFVWISFLCIGFFIIKGTVKHTFASVCYIFYIVYLFVSLAFWSPDHWFGIRVIAKYLFPLLIMLFASKVVNSEFVPLSCIKWMALVALFAEISLLLGLPWIGIFWPWSTMGDHVVIVVVVCLALLQVTKKKKYLLLMMCFFAFPLLATIRTGLLGITVCLSVYFLIKYKWKALPVVLGVVSIAILVVLYVPTVRDKMFRKQLSAQEVIDNRDNMSMSDIDTNGRQAMWDWSLNKFYEDNKLFGVGVGNLQKVFYSGAHPFGTIRVVHNDFIQILCDTGLLGLILYLLTALGVVIHSIYIYNDLRNNQTIRLCAIVAGSSLVGILVTSYTDNSVNYSFATYCYPYAFYGMALGLKRKYETPSYS